MAIHLPQEIERQAQEEAERRGIGTDAFVTAAVAEKLRDVARGNGGERPFYETASTEEIERELDALAEEN